MDDSYKQGGGEARRINVVYFLSRGGRTDQPHLFRVNLGHHLHRAGVRLRDVKRWLSEVRGKDMPDSFSWSYKRKYKAGYVWQDLVDDDLVTPISDNEYVLKGCDVRRTPPPCADGPKGSPLDEKKLSRKGSWEQKLVEEALQVQVTRDYDKSSPKPPPLPVDQDSPGADQATPFRIVLPQDLQQRKQRRQREAAARDTATEQKQALVVAPRAAVPGGGERHKQQRPAVGNRERRMRVSQVLHSILTCGAAADAVDDAVVPRRSAGAIDDGEDGDGWQQRTPVCPGMDGCGIHMSRKVKLHQRGGKDGSKAKRDGGRRDRVAAAHKPATLPRCSQCGKQFKPQELHSHMQSCRGLRERMRSSAAARAQVSVDRSRSSTAKAGHSSTERPHAAVFLLTES